MVVAAAAYNPPGYRNPHTNSESAVKLSDRRDDGVQLFGREFGINRQRKRLRGGTL
jgi:hypothetical protein